MSSWPNERGVLIRPGIRGNRVPRRLKGGLGADLQASRGTLTICGHTVRTVALPAARSSLEGAQEVRDESVRACRSGTYREHDVPIGICTMCHKGTDLPSAAGVNGGSSAFSLRGDARARLP